jgi:YD repeat-containing protein
MTYDAIGQVTRVTRPDNSYFDYVYDGAKRVTSVTSNLGEKIEYVYDLMSNVTSRMVKGATGTIVKSQTAAFDELGRTLRSIGASNQTTTYSYDKTSNLKSTTDPRGRLFSYAYDSVNRLIQELDPNGSAVNYTKDTRSLTTVYADPRNLQTTYLYNGFREMIRQTSPDSGITNYVRDNRGLVTKITDGRSVVTDMTYDNIGRMLTKTYPAAVAENVSYVYDTFVAGTNFGKGRVSKITSQSVVIDLIYDQRGNPGLRPLSRSRRGRLTDREADDWRAGVYGGLRLRQGRPRHADHLSIGSCGQLCACGRWPHQRRHHQAERDGGGGQPRQQHRLPAAVGGGEIVYVR